MAYKIPPLRFAYDALEPYIDAGTMELHHDQHHQTYVDNLNRALEPYPDLADLAIEDLLGPNGRPEPWWRPRQSPVLLGDSRPERRRRPEGLDRRRPHKGVRLIRGIPVALHGRRDAALRLGLGLPRGRPVHRETRYHLAGRSGQRAGARQDRAPLL